MAKIYIVGAGPGDPDYVTPIARRIVRQAELVIGSERALKLFDGDIRGEVVVLSPRNLREVMIYAVERAREGKSVAMISTGDPCFAGLLGTFLRTFEANLDVEVEVIPGVSAIQVCAARLKICWDEAFLVSFHEGASQDKKRSLSEALTSGKTVIILPDPKAFTPKDIAKYLLSEGVDGGLTTYICENLTLNNEKIVKMTLREAASYDVGPLCVMAITPKRDGHVEV